MAAGRKTGGRQKGTPNKSTAARAAEIAEAGLTPLDYMLGLLRDEAQTSEVRFEAARQAAPYCHPKLAAVDANVDGDIGFTVVIQKPEAA